MERSKEMENVLNKMFPVERGLVDIGNCPLCGDAIDENSFKDELSRKEFKISGMCQKCQDRIFAEPGE